MLCRFLIYFLVFISVLPLVIADDLPRAGDNKEGYESSSYTTSSRSIEKRKGKATDLYALSQAPQLGLPKAPIAGRNPQTREGIACLLYTSPSPRDRTRSRMPSSA